MLGRMNIELKGQSCVDEQSYLECRGGFVDLVRKALWLELLLESLQRTGFRSTRWMIVRTPLSGEDVDDEDQEVWRNFGLITLAPSPNSI